MAIILLLTFFIIATSTINNKENIFIMDFRNSYGKICFSHGKRRTISTLRIGVDWVKV